MNKKIELLFNEITKREKDNHKFDKEINVVNNKISELNVIRDGIKNKMQMNKEQLDRDYVTLKELIIKED